MQFKNIIMAKLLALTSNIYSAPVPGKGAKQLTPEQNIQNTKIAAAIIASLAQMAGGITSQFNPKAGQLVGTIGNSVGGTMGSIANAAGVAQGIPV